MSATALAKAGNNSHLVWKVKPILQEPGVFHQSKLVWIIFGIVDIAACLAQPIENVIQNCVRDRVVARRCDSAEVFEEQLVASDSLNGLRGC